MEVGRSLGRSRRPGLRPNSSDASKDKAANLVVLLHKAEDNFGQVQVAQLPSTYTLEAYMWEMNQRRNYPL